MPHLNSRTVSMRSRNILAIHMRSHQFALLTQHPAWRVRRVKYVWLSVDKGGWLSDSQAEGLTDAQAGMLAGRQAGRQAASQTSRQADRQTDRQRQTYITQYIA